MTERASTNDDLSQRADLLAIAGLIQPGEKVLDLGCGDGTLLRYLKDRYGITGRGVELREAEVLACVRRGISVRQGNLHEGLGDYPDGSFDTVILSQTIPYLNDPAFITWEMLRVGARAIISIPNWGYWRCRLSLLLTGRMPIVPALPQVWDEAPRARPLTIQDFEDFCEVQKFRINRQIYLNGSCRLTGRFDKNLRATVAVFELRGGNEK
ncbi:MAG: methionine biosynthesis protein MetW [Anaerolineales bacterium]|nr:methionine biosynthesis protein MetW [Anaerolineales bacterium]